MLLMQLFNYPIDSNIGSAFGFQNCEQFQALDCDYYQSGFDPGHLAPNAINSRDEEKQTGTFTLTNAAPQYGSFNRGQ